MSVRVSTGRIALIALLVITTLGVRGTYAEDSTTIDISVTTTEVGVFSVAMSGADGDDPSFGTVGVNANLDVAVEGHFVLIYTDTLSDRGGGTISLLLDSFEPVDPVPPFPGSDQVHFQIPNRYLTLTHVGDISSDEAPPGCSLEPGSITPVVDDLLKSFDDGGPLVVASVEAGCGIGTATQPVELTLTVPAGVYPTTYEATVTIESTVE